MAWLLLSLTAAPAAALDPDRSPGQYLVASWDDEDGLPQRTIAAILQTRDGYLWLGTDAGLVRFDGTRFTRFDASEFPTLGTGDIKALHQDADGTLWIGVFGGGLVRYRDGELVAFGTDAGLPSLLVRALAPAPGGGLWVGTEGGGVARFRNGRARAAVTTEQGLLKDDVRTLLTSRSGDLWIGGEGLGLARYRNGEVRTWTREDGLESNTLTALYEDAEGDLWIATAWGLNRLHGERLSGYGLDDGLSSDYLFSLGGDRDGNLWIGTGGGGLARLAQGRFASLSAADGLPDDHVWAVHEDREGNLWVGTESGLARVQSGSFAVWGRRQGLAADYVRGIHGGEGGAVWLGTAAGLNRLRGGAVETWTERDGLPSEGVWSLLQTASGELWLSGDPAGVARLRDGRWTTWHSEDGLGSSTVWSLVEDRDGTVWAGCQGGGLSRFTDGRWTTLSRRDGLGADTVRTLLADRYGDLWAGTQGGGLSRVRDGAVTTYTTADGLGSETVLSLYEDGDGELWVGTSGGGLSLRRGERFVSGGLGRGLFADTVGAIVEDDLGYLWLSTDRGLVRATRSALREWLDGDRDTVPHQSFGSGDGLTGNLGAGFTPAAWKADDGRLWFPSRAGAAVVDPRRLAANPVPPLVAVERLLADHREVDLRTRPELPPGTFDLEIHYAALSFTAPSKVRARYRLEGFDADWVEAEDRRVAYYTNLPPGSYRFRVLASNEHGVSSPEAAVLDLELLPRFYQTAWFLTAMATLLLLGAYGLYRLRVSHLEARTALAEERARLARELHDTIAQDLGAIVMQARAAQREHERGEEGAGSRIGRIASLAERGLAETRRSVYALRPQALEGRDLAAALEATVRGLSRSGAPRIEVTARGSRRPLRPAVEAELLRIGGEAVGNAVRHAGARRIAVDLDIGRREAVLAVQDDGSGFETSAAAGGCFGLIGMRERAESLGGRFAIESAAGRGTRVEVRVPLSGRGR